MAAPDSSNTPSSEIEKIFTEAQTCLDGFKQEYSQLEAARQAAETSKDLQSARKAEGEIKQLSEKVEELEWEIAQKTMGLLGESVQRKIMVNAQQESFWEFIRYAGLGFALGVGLKYLIR
jgi:protein subunit release factor A